MFDDLQDATGPATAIVQSAIEYFVNFAQEIGVLESVLLNLVVGIGVLISASAVLDLTRLGNPKHQGKTSAASIAVRFMVGPATIQLNLFMRALAESVFGTGAQQASMSAQSYSEAAGQTDPVAGLLVGIVAFLVFIGWVTAVRAMMAFARVGNPQENGYELFRTGASRLVAATFLCMFQFVMDDLLESFTGSSDVFSNQLNLTLTTFGTLPIS